MCVVGGREGILSDNVKFKMPVSHLSGKIKLEMYVCVSLCVQTCIYIYICVYLAWGTAGLEDIFGSN